MSSYSTKLKVGRKLDGVDTDTASDNQISVLLRYEDETGAEDHVSVSIESDAMTVDDVFALLEFLDERGVLSATECKTWLHQSKASREGHGETTEWADQDVDQKVDMANRGLSTRSSPSNGGGRQAKNALLKLSELETKLDEVKQTLRGAEDDKDTEEDTAESSGPTPPNAL
jgi:hypothetical protein